MLGFVGDYAHWCYSRNDISAFADIHDNLLFRFVFAPVGETLVFLAPFLLALCVLTLISERVSERRN